MICAAIRPASSRARPTFSAPPVSPATCSFAPLARDSHVRRTRHHERPDDGKEHAPPPGRPGICCGCRLDGAPTPQPEEAGVRKFGRGGFHFGVATHRIGGCAAAGGARGQRVKLRAGHGGLLMARRQGTVSVPEWDSPAMASSRRCAASRPRPLNCMSMEVSGGLDCSAGFAVVEAGDGYRTWYVDVALAQDVEASAGDPRASSTDPPLPSASVMILVACALMERHLGPRCCSLRRSLLRSAAAQSRQLPITGAEAVGGQRSSKAENLGPRLDSWSRYNGASLGSSYVSDLGWLSPRATGCRSVSRARGPFSWRPVRRCGPPTRPGRR